MGRDTPFLAGLRLVGRSAFASIVTVDQGMHGLVYLDGKFLRELGAGTFGFWEAAGAPPHRGARDAPPVARSSGAEILTRDKVSLRVNLSAVFEITDARAAQAGMKDVREHLYRVLQIAAQEARRRTRERELAHVCFSHYPQAWT
jgi:regulator of protease activity HflC (stomatin/prohibitin superfamily)